MVNEWTPVVKLVDRLIARLDGIAEETVARIRDELADFALVPIEEHRESVGEQLYRRLVAFRDRRAWGPTDLEQAVALAQRRARQGISVDVLISAYHVGDRELWRNLSTASGATRVLLPELTSLMLESMQAISTTLASAHSREVRARDRTHLVVSQRLVDLLDTDAEGAEAARLANYLGYDPNRSCVALACRPDQDQSATLELADLIGSDRITVVQARRGATLVLILQGEPAAVASVIAELVPSCLIGVGAPQLGLAGAARSLRQAQVALSAASIAQRVSAFADNWVISCIASLGELLEDEVGTAVTIAGAHGALRDTVWAFARADMSVTGCGRDSHLHPNTVGYRLRRWRDLTGWDPRTFTGLAKSVVACALAEVADSGSGGLRTPAGPDR